MSAPSSSGDRVVPALARELAARLAALFERDVEIVRRLNDAQRRVREANERLWSGLSPDAFGLIYDGIGPAGSSQIAALIMGATAPSVGEVRDVAGEVRRLAMCEAGRGWGAWGGSFAVWLCVKRRVGRGCRAGHGGVGLQRFVAALGPPAGCACVAMRAGGGPPGSGLFGGRTPWRPLRSGCLKV